MSDELEQKRQEKIANFKVTFDDDVYDPADISEQKEISSSSETNITEEDISSDSAQQENDVEFIMDISRENDEYDDISSGNISDGIESFTDTPSETDVDKATLRKAQRADKKRKKKKAKKNRILFRVVWIVMMALVGIVLGQYIMVGVNDLLAVGREKENSVSVTIPKDASLDTVTDILVKNKVINNPGFFKLYATLTRSTTGFTQGTFDVETNKDYQALINYLQSTFNRTDVVTLQFTEGMTVQEYAEKLDKGKVCDKDEFLKLCNSNEFDKDYEFIGDIKNQNKRYYKLEGYLFPDTYDFFVGEDTDSVIRKFLANYRRKIYLTKSRADGFDKKVTIEERAKKMGLTMEEVINLASLIQAEAASTEDMYVISSILHNRLATLENGGRNSDGEAGLGYLQLDSTVYYPYPSEQDIPINIRSTYVSNYSTYKYEGLPAGPICNPGLEAILAVVNPDKTDYYYFCHKAATADEPAVAYYARTNSEHLANQEKAGLFDDDNEGSQEEENNE